MALILVKDFMKTLCVHLSVQEFTPVSSAKAGTSPMVELWEQPNIYWSSHMCLSLLVEECRHWFPSCTFWIWQDSKFMDFKLESYWQETWEMYSCTSDSCDIGENIEGTEMAPRTQGNLIHSLSINDGVKSKLLNPWQTTASQTSDFLLLQSPLLTPFLPLCHPYWMTFLQFHDCTLQFHASVVWHMYCFPGLEVLRPSHSGLLGKLLFIIRTPNTKVFSSR